MHHKHALNFNSTVNYLNTLSLYNINKNTNTIKQEAHTSAINHTIIHYDT